MTDIPITKRLRTDLDRCEDALYGRAEAAVVLKDAFRGIVEAFAALEQRLDQIEAGLCVSSGDHERRGPVDGIAQLGDVVAQVYNISAGAAIGQIAVRTTADHEPIHELLDAAGEGCRTNDRAKWSWPLEQTIFAVALLADSVEDIARAIQDSPPHREPPPANAESGIAGNTTAKSG